MYILDYNRDCSCPKQIKQKLEFINVKQFRLSRIKNSLTRHLKRADPGCPPMVQICVWVQLVFWTGKVCFLIFIFLKIELKTGLAVKMETCSDIKTEVLVHVMFNCQISCGKMRIFTREQWSVQRNIHAEFQSIENREQTWNMWNHKQDKQSWWKSDERPAQVQLSRLKIIVKDWFLILVVY